MKQHEKKSKKCSEQSERTKFRQMKELKKELNITKKIKIADDNPFFSEEDVKVLLEDCKSSSRGET